MSETLERRAEIQKLARLLQVEPEHLGYLDAIDHRELRALRERTTDSLFDGDRRRLQRLAAGSPLLPTPILATVAEKATGPLLCARLAGMVDVQRGVDVAKRLKAPFLADVAVELDPRHASELISRLGAEQVEPVAAELGRRGEHVTMGRFVGHLSDEVIGGVVHVFDGETLLRTGFVLEDKERLDAVVAVVGEESLREVVRVAADLDLWPEALDLATHCGEVQRGRLADVAAAEDDHVLGSMVAAAHEAQLWDAALPFVRSMSPAARERFAQIPAVHDEAVLRGIIAAAAEHALWPELLPLTAVLPVQARRAAAAAATTLPPEALEAAAVTAQEHDLWAELLAFAADVEPAERDALVAVVLDGPVERFAGVAVGVAEAVGEPELAARAIGMLGELGPPLQARIADAARGALTTAQRDRLAARAVELGVADQLGAELRAALGL